MKCNFFAMCMCRRIVIAGVICTFFSLYALPTQFASAQGSAYIRVIHASPFVGTADVFVDGTKLLSSFQFASVTNYVPVPQGVHKVQIALVGKGMDAAALTQNLDVQAGVTYTVAAVGATANTLNLKVFVDNNQISPGHAKLRIYPLAPDAGAVNVTIGNGTMLDDMTYQDASNYLVLNSGSYKLDLTDPQFGTTLPLSTTLTSNMVTSVFAVGLFQGNPKVQLVSAQTAGVPGLPGTGSDPNLHTTDGVATDPFIGWFLLAGILALVGLSVVVHRRRLEYL